jgi:hypothetical protein
MGGYLLGCTLPKKSPDAVRRPGQVLGKQPEPEGAADCDGSRAPSWHSREQNARQIPAKRLKIRRKTAFAQLKMTITMTKKTDNNIL